MLSVFTQVYQVKPEKIRHTALQALISAILCLSTTTKEEDTMDVPRKKMYHDMFLSTWRHFLCIHSAQKTHDGETEPQDSRRMKHRRKPCSYMPAQTSWSWYYEARESLQVTLFYSAP